MFVGYFEVKKIKNNIFRDNSSPPVIFYPETSNFISEFNLLYSGNHYDSILPPPPAVSLHPVEPKGVADYR